MTFERKLIELSRKAEKQLRVFTMPDWWSDLYSCSCLVLLCDGQNEVAGVTPFGQLVLRLNGES